MERVVVTGFGAVSPFGVGASELWRGVAGCAAAFDEIRLFDADEHRTQLAGQVPADADLFDGIDDPVLSRTDRFSILAAREAFDLAGLLTPADRADAGVYFGSSAGGMLEGEVAYLGQVSGEPRQDARGHMRLLRTQPVSAPASAVARHLGLHGPLETSSTACAAATMAIETALVSLRSGDVELAVAGGADGLCQLTHGGFNSLRAVSPLATRPFRKDREGLNLGEGAAVLVLETESHARARGAQILAELAGAGSSCDAHHMTAPHPEGRGAQLAMTRAIADAQLNPDDIDFVNAHGTGTPHNDAAEWQAVRSVFGPRADGLALTSTKGAVGHLLGACGALEAVVTIQCLRAGAVHPTPGHGEQDPECPVDLVTEVPRELARCETALSVNLAFGGANSAIVLRRWQGGAS